MEKIDIDKYNKIIDYYKKDIDLIFKSDVIEGFGANPMAKIIKPIQNVFKQSAKIFKLILKAFKFDNKKLAAILATIVIPFFGQFFARIFWLDGSLDKSWLLLFGIPPLTLLPAGMMMFGLVKKGKGGKPWDNYIFGPIIINIIASLLLPNIFSIYTAVILKYVLVSISFFLIYWNKSKKICKDKSANNSKLLSDSLTSYVLMVIFALALEYMPLFGTIFKIIEKLVPQSRLIIESFAILLIYVITNMINGSYNKYCSVAINSKSMSTLIIFSIIIALMTSRLK